MFLGLLPLLGALLWLADAQAAPAGNGFAPLKKGQILRGRFEQFRTAGGNHDRINNQLRSAECGVRNAEEIGDNADIFHREQHSGFYR